MDAQKTKYNVQKTKENDTIFMAFRIIIIILRHLLINTFHSQE